MYQIGRTVYLITLEHKIGFASILKLKTVNFINANYGFLHFQRNKN